MVVTDMKILVESSIVSHVVKLGKIDDNSGEKFQFYNSKVLIIQKTLRHVSLTLIHH